MTYDPLAGLADHLRPYVTADGARIHAPHVDLSHWYEEAVHYDVKRVELANAIDRKEAAFARLAWIMKDHEDYVARHTLRFRFQALIECFERCGAIPFDPDAKLTDDLGPAARLAWLSCAGRYGFHGDEDEERRLWAWMISVLRRAGQGIMTAMDLMIYEAIPDRVPLHRGFGAPACTDQATLEAMARSPSWTTDMETAAFFARHGQSMRKVKDGGEIEAFVASANVSKSGILAWLGPVDSGADFDEFVIDDPAAMHDIRIKRLS